MPNIALVEKKRMTVYAHTIDKLYSTMSRHKTYFKRIVSCRKEILGGTRFNSLPKPLQQFLVRIIIDDILKVLANKKRGGLTVVLFDRSFDMTETFACVASSNQSND
jgi:hypothetical protein